MKTYAGILTKTTSIPGQVANFANGYKVECFFTKPPEVGKSFQVTPTAGEFKYGFFHTSNVAEIVGEVVNQPYTHVTFITQNSMYRLTYWEVSL